jgi:hypothetical protein
MGAATFAWPLAACVLLLLVMLHRAARAELKT